MKPLKKFIPWVLLIIGGLTMYALDDDIRIAFFEFGISVLGAIGFGFALSQKK